LRIHTTIDKPACITQRRLLSVVWFEHQNNKMFVIQRSLGGRLDLSAR
jgi:hypothetical protein